MAELHIIGQIAGASGFDGAGAVFCKWGVAAGACWDLVEGHDEGQTHADAPRDGGPATWAQPIDVHYSVRGLAGWPKLHFQVWAQDVHGRNDLCEYACRGWGGSGG